MNRVNESDRLWAPATMEYLARVVFEETSIRIEADRSSLWRSRLSPLLRTLDMADAKEMVDRLRSGDRQLRCKVVDAMTTNETLFFRDGSSFEDALLFLITELLQRRERLQSSELRGDPKRPLTIWSAASSSGQEIYSIAMFLDRHFPELVKSGDVRLLATDVSHAMVERVREGRFTALEVRRGLPRDYRDAYMTSVNGSWEVAPHLRSLVQAEVVNLVRPFTSIPQCDLVLLRNVLIYFAESERQSILARLQRDVVRPHGALIIGASEIVNSKHFVYERLESGVCYRPAALPVHV